MLKSWSIQNFKAIANSGELRLAPVTVLAGLNSSGKTSLLQSILMISQTLSNRLLDRSLVPNGPIMQLGTFEDIVYRSSDIHTIAIHFELSVDDQAEMYFDENDEPFVVPGPYVQSIAVNALFRRAEPRSAPAIEASKVHTAYVSLTVTSKDEIGFGSRISGLGHNELQFSLREVDEDEWNRLIRDVDPERRHLLSYQSQGPRYVGDFETPHKKSSDGYLLALSHFLPRRLLYRFSRAEQRKHYVINALDFLLNADTPEATTYPSLLLKESSPSLERARKGIHAFFEDRQLTGAFSGRSFQEMIQWYRSLRTRMAEEQFRAIKDKLSDIVIQSVVDQDLFAQVEDDEEESAPDLPSLIDLTIRLQEDLLSRAIEHVTGFFTNKIRYLGPLRADPQAAQKYPLSSEFDDVGSKGEYAASVYEANQDAPIEWYNPLEQQSVHGTLREALESWIRYLSVAQSITIETAGSSGFRWQVIHKEGQKPLPLSAVGIGVSQVLPILVMGLLSSRHTLLIIEQPELHLHPRVQARLGDFFIGLAKCGKQCLIETHAENLVSQLRYHIVRSCGQEKSDCAIYFASQNEQGAAEFEPIEISARGNILNWPEGFFDETFLQQDRITEESLKQRAKLINHE